MADERESKGGVGKPAALSRKDAAREDRLAVALRANLRRRKAAPPGAQAPDPRAPGPRANRPGGKGA